MRESGERGGVEEGVSEKRSVRGARCKAPFSAWTSMWEEGPSSVRVREGIAGTVPLRAAERRRREQERGRERPQERARGLRHSLVGFRERLSWAPREERGRILLCGGLSVVPVRSLLAEAMNVHPRERKHDDHGNRDTTSRARTERTRRTHPKRREGLCPTERAGARDEHRVRDGSGTDDAAIRRVR